jgi:hypothetical protein
MTCRRLDGLSDQMTVARTVCEIEWTAPAALRRDRFTDRTCELIPQQVEIRLERVVAERFWVSEKNLDGQQTRSRVGLQIALNHAAWTRSLDFTVVR